MLAPLTETVTMDPPLLKYLGWATFAVMTAKVAQPKYLSSGGSMVTVSVSGANIASATVSDNHDGTYTAVYTPSASGWDMVDIRLDGHGIIGNTFTSLVSWNTVDPSHTTAVVPNGAVGMPTTITIQARDPQGNPWSLGGSNVTVAIAAGSANAGAQTQVTDNG